MNEMRKSSRLSVLVAAAFAAAASLVSTGAGAVDADAAMSLARRSSCLKCHAVDKKKDGPSYKSVAAKWKGKPDAEAKLIKHITTGPKIKFEDGSEDTHAIVKSKDPKEIKNLVDWILSL